MNWMNVPSDKLLESIITMVDMRRSLCNSKPTVNAEDLHKLTKFTAAIGQEG